MITPEDIKTRFKEFSCLSDREIQMFIDDAVLILNISFWGKKYDMGLSYLTAHFLVLAGKSALGNTGATNPVSGKAVDGTSITFAVPTPEEQTEAYFSSTGYGQRYWAMRSKLGVVAFVI